MDTNEIIGYEDSFKVTEEGIAHIGHSVILKRYVEDVENNLSSYYPKTIRCEKLK